MTSGPLRRHQRIRVSTPIKMVVANGAKAPRVEGMATVIGLGGMFVRTKNTSPPGTVIKIGVSSSLELECAVRDVDENGMGVEFTALTPENLEKLEKLLVQLKP
jgi:hypothetical protein